MMPSQERRRFTTVEQIFSKYIASYSLSAREPLGVFGEPNTGVELANELLEGFRESVENTDRSEEADGSRTGSELA